MQYSLGKAGHGNLSQPVDFFSTNDIDEVKMFHSKRKCAGVKVCEFLPQEMKDPHMEVDLDGLKWAKLFATQSRKEAISSSQKNEVLFEEWYSKQCDRYKIGRAYGTCGGRSVIISKLPNTRSNNQIGLIYIGCSNYQKGERGHLFFPLKSIHDSNIIIQMWDKEQCYVRSEMLNALNFDWNEIQNCMTTIKY